MNKTFRYTILLLSVLTLSACQQKQPEILDEAAQTEAKPESQETAVEKTISLEELSKFNGEDDKPAYVAVDGFVYDVSDVFIKGKHYQHIAGQDLTEDFYTTHMIEQIKKYPVIAKLSK